MFTHILYFYVMLPILIIFSFFFPQMICDSGAGVRVGLGRGRALVGGFSLAGFLGGCTGVPGASCFLTPALTFFLAFPPRYIFFLQ